MGVAESSVIMKLIMRVGGRYWVTRLKKPNHLHAIIKESLDLG